MRLKLGALALSASGRRVSRQQNRHIENNHGHGASSTNGHACAVSWLEIVVMPASIIELRPMARRRNIVGKRHGVSSWQGDN